MQQLLIAFLASLRADTIQYEQVPILDRELNRKDVNNAIVRASFAYGKAWDGKAGKKK